MPKLRRISSLLPLFVLFCHVVVAQSPLRLKTVVPCRLVDTRPNNGGSGPIPGGTAATFNLPSLAQSGGSQGKCAAFSLSSASAYSLNVTLVPPNNAPVSYLTIWPTGEPQPLVSLMNSIDGRIKANAAIVPAGTNGEVNVFVSNTTNVLIDIDAYFDSASDGFGAGIFSSDALSDTRHPHQRRTYIGGPGTRLPYTGNCAIPSNAVAYSFNITAVPSGGGVGYVTVLA